MSASRGSIRADQPSGSGDGRRRARERLVTLASIRDRVRTATGQLCEAIDGRRAVLLTALCVWLAILLTLFARAKPFWHDEVYTILISQLPLTAFVQASRDDVDLSPPLNTLLTHAVHAVAGVGLVTTRLPAMAGLLAAVVLLFVTVRRRSNALAGCVAAITPCFTPAWAYAIEARGYGLSLGCFAAALHGWSEAAAGRRPALHWTIMAAALAAGTWAHYYALLAVLPIAAGELVRQITIRRFDAAPWMAIGAAGAAALPLWPILALANEQRATFWAGVTMPGVGTTYGYLLGELSTFAITGVALVAIVVIELVRRTRTTRSARRLSPHDLAACLVCLVLPAAGVALGHATGVFTERYVVFSTIGLAFALPLLFWRFMPDTRVGELIALAALVVSLVGLTARTVREPPVFRNPLAYHPTLAGVLEGSSRMAMTGGIAFLGVWYNLPEQDRSRVMYLADPIGQLRQTGTDTIDRGYLALARWTPVPVAPVGAFAEANPRFLLYSFASGWAERTLRSMGATMVVRGRAPFGDAVVYEVTLPGR